MKPTVTAQQAACLSLLLYGESGNTVARVLGVTPGTVSRWRRRLEDLGLIGAPATSQGGRPRGEYGRGAPRRAGAEPDDALTPEERRWIEEGWGEYHAREWAAMEVGSDWWSRNRRAIGKKKREES